MVWLFLRLLHGRWCCRSSGLGRPAVTSSLTRIITSEGGPTAAAGAGHRFIFKRFLDGSITLSHCHRSKSLRYKRNSEQQILCRTSVCVPEKNK